jgi:hypothetical protein
MNSKMQSSAQTRDVCNNERNEQALGGLNVFGRRRVKLFWFECIYDVISSMPTWPGGVAVSFLAMGVVECTGSSTVDVLVLGMELLWGDCAVLDKAGVGGASVRSGAAVGESTRVKRYIFFSTCSTVSKGVPSRSSIETY